MPMLAAAGCCYSAAGCCWLLLLDAGCWCCRPRAARARSPGGIFEDFLKKNLKKNWKKVSKIFGDTLSRIVIDYKNDHPPPPAPSN
jgi:hypothetical protein